MRFQPVRYMAWAKRTHDIAPVRYDLSTSAVSTPPRDLLGPLDDLPISGNNAYGSPALRERLAGRYGVPGERVLCSIAGTSLANFLVAAAVVESGDAVALEWPVYEPLRRIFDALGARVIPIERRREARFALDLDRVETLFAQGTRVLFVTNPSNPGGTLLAPEVIEAAGEAAARHGAWLIVDEIYMDGVYGRPVRSAARREDGTLPERTIVTSSLTKSYGLGMLRAGWAIAPREVVERAYVVHDHLGVEQPYVADALALRALDRLPSLRARAEAIRHDGWRLVQAWAGGRPDVDLLEPDGGFIAWLRLPAGVTSHALEGPLRALDAAVAPGHYFGAPDHARLGYGGAPEMIQEALARLSQALDGMKGRS